MNDPVLVARLRDYIRDTHGNRASMDITIVADDLRAQYPEYGRKALGVFKQRVVQAYQLLQLKQQAALAQNNNNNPGFAIDYSSNPELATKDSQKNNAPSTPLGKTRSEEKTSSVKPAKIRRRRSPDRGGPSGDPDGLLPPAFSESLKPASYPTLRLADLGGLDHIKDELERMLRHLRNAPLLRQLGAEPSRGLLLHGPPGCGKTSLAIAVAGELGLPLMQTAGPELVAGISGQSEAQLRNLFKSASTRHRETGCVLFIDELDVVAGRRESVSRDLERRLVSQLLLCIDQMPSTVLLIGATSRPDALDPGLRRTGRFDRELCLGQPGENERADMLRVLTRSIPIAEHVSLAQVARLTPGYVASDLKALVNAAAGAAVERYTLANPQLLAIDAPNTSDSLEKQAETSQPVEAIDVDQMEDDEVKILDLDTEDENGNPANSEKIEKCSEGKKSGLALVPTLPSDLKVELPDFMSAVKFVQPSAKREGFATVPDVNWSDVGALEAVRYELFMAVVAPLHRPDIFKKLGLKGSPGILLFGPPGCGKTLLAKAVANESGLNFVAVNGPELLNMYVGESERAVRQVFSRARASSPCLVFFDELDSLCPVRAANSSSGSDTASSRVVNQMLCELDGVQGRGSQVFVLAATNRPDMVDPAVLRPGRFDKLLYVGLPSEAGRLDVLRALTKQGTRPKISQTNVLEQVAKAAEGFTGADLSALVREAAVIAAGPLLKNVAAKSGCVARQPHNSDTTVVSGQNEADEDDSSAAHNVEIDFVHFERAMARCHRSVKPEDLRKYERLCQRYTVAEPDSMLSLSQNAAGDGGVTESTAS